MQLKFFTIPVGVDDLAVDDLNKFLSSVKVLEVKKEFVNQQNGAFWSVCVTYLPHLSEGFTTKGRIVRKTDYKGLLSQNEFEAFSKLRKIRKELAEMDAVPPFAVFSDAELAEIAKISPMDVSEMLKIDGIGQKKVEKYGLQMINKFNDLTVNIPNEESRKSEGKNP